MLPWNPSDWSASSLLLAASLFPSMAPAVETPVTPLEKLQQETAQQRWERLKARYQPVVAADPMAPVREKVESAEIRPIPEAQSSEEWTASRPQSAPPIPDGTEEPAWITSAAPSAPIPAPAVPNAPEASGSVATVAAPNLTVPQVEPHLSPSTSTPMIERREIPPTPADPFDLRMTEEFANERISTVAAQADPALPLQPDPQAAPTTRPVRSMSEIQPFYDTNVDEDIRKYAEERAEDYHVKFGDEQYQPRLFADTAMAWEPTNMYHYPLYFEDAVLERYGHTYPFVVQPFVSVAKFSGQLLALPYQMTIDPITKPIYPLGWYRPGEVAPKLKYQIPWNAQAAAVQAGVTTGLIFLIP